ncbi:MAG: thioredoxin domain-containing protein [Geobacteraceae bacterium]
MQSSLPGASQFDKELINKFEEVRKQRGKDYHPRTKHFRPDGWPRYTNRLFMESSTYLLQHAHNPVNWFPWGDEAFDLAGKLNRPVLVSIGYSTCHWCHVMENESFEDEDIARYLNENFVVIKVDREERPDLDAIYMSAVQALTGRGGWPLNVWLTPDRKPFYGGTYFPPRDLMSLLKKVKEAFASEPEQIVESSRQLSLTIKQALSPELGEGLLSANVMHSAAQAYRSYFDAANGGLQGAPKFPSSLPVRFLLRYQRRTGKDEFQSMAELTLNKMAAGGMYDQVGGGFHRYSTDEEWLVPHFEKMLYDNALLAITYLEGYQATKNKDFERITREIFRYFERDISSPGGAFYAASDADSLAPGGHQEEGYFFTWTPKELDQVLGKDRAKIVETYYGVTEQGNFEGRNILHVPQLPSAIAQSLKIPEAELKTVIDESKELLYQMRSRRPLPLRDEKILTAWNGLAISAYARAGLILNDPHYVEQAIKATRFILENCYVNGRLLRSYKDGKARGNAYLEDYSFFITALLDLLEATNDPQWLERAVELDDVLQRHYEDRHNGGFFMTGDDHELLLAREKPAYDGATPSGNSVQVLNLLRLAEFTTNENYRTRAEKAMKSFSGTLCSKPMVLSEMLLALDFHLDTAKEIIIVAPKGNKEAASSLLSVFRAQFLPNRIILVVMEGEELEAMAKIIPLIKEKKALKEKATAYVCENKSCRLPTDDPKLFVEQIRKIERLP